MALHGNGAAHVKRHHDKVSLFKHCLYILHFGAILYSGVPCLFKEILCIELLLRQVSVLIAWLGTVCFRILKLLHGAQTV